MPKLKSEVTGSQGGGVGIKLEQKLADALAEIMMSSKPYVPP